MKAWTFLAKTRLSHCISPGRHCSTPTAPGECTPEYSGGPTTESQMLEVCVGAILTQNTNWKNVEKSIRRHIILGIQLDLEHIERDENIDAHQCFSCCHKNNSGGIDLFYRQVHFPS